MFTLGAAPTLCHTAPNSKSSSHPLLWDCAQKGTWSLTHSKMLLDESNIFVKWISNKWTSIYQPWPVSGPLAGARKRKMNEIQPLHPKRSESSCGHSDGSEMITYDTFEGRGCLYFKKDKSPCLGYITTWKQRSGFQKPVEQASGFTGNLFFSDYLLSEGKERGN